MNSKDGKNRKKGSAKKAIFIILTVFILAAAGGGIAFFVWNKEGQSDSPFRGGMASGGNFTLSEDMVAASGVISVEVTEESFEVENLSAALEIEEIYVSSGQELEEGTRILRLSEESVTEARKELEKLVDICYSNGVKVIDATIPLSEMFGYATDLRSRTQGRGQFTMQFSHYAEVPRSISEKIIGERGKKAE